MAVTGSVDVSNAVFFLDDFTGFTDRYSMTSTNMQLTGPGGVTREIVTGVNLSPGWVSIAIPIFGSRVSGSGDFGLGGSRFIAYSSNDTGVLDDDIMSASISVSNLVIDFAGQDFSSMGLNVHATNIDIDLWGASASATDAEKIKFHVVSSIPEPSSISLLGLGVITLLVRRRLQPPISPPSGPAQRLFQEPPAKSKFLAATGHSPPGEDSGFRPRTSTIPHQTID